MPDFLSSWNIINSAHDERDLRYVLWNFSRYEGPKCKKASVDNFSREQNKKLKIDIHRHKIHTHHVYFTS